MNENKVRSYIYYAVGEVLLVVMGILIALQINNWNQSRLDREFEFKSLSEIQSALENDILYFDNMLYRLSRLDSSISIMKKQIYNKETFIDSLYKGPTRWYYLRTGIAYQYNRGPYDALKSIGLDKVSSDDLRRALIDYYDFSAIRRSTLVQFYDESYTDQSSRLESFLGENFVEKEGDDYNIYSKFPADLYADPEFLNLLVDMEFRASLQSFSIINQQEEMKNLKDTIIKYLEGS